MKCHILGGTMSSKRCLNVRVTTWAEFFHKSGEACCMVDVIYIQAVENWVALLEKETATHSSVLAWRIPGMGLHRVGHDWSDLAAALVKNLPASAGDASDSSLIPGLGRFPGGGHSDPLQYSCLENPMSREAWQTTVHRVAESWTQLKGLSMHASKEIAVSLRKVHWGGWLRK